MKTMKLVKANNHGDGMLLHEIVHLIIEMSECTWPATALHARAKLLGEEQVVASKAIGLSVIRMIIVVKEDGAIVEMTVIVEPVIVEVLV